MTGRLGRWLEKLLHVHDTPERTAAAFAVGVFFGFSPFLGLHTVLGVLCAFLLRLNRVAVVVGVYSNTPWFIAPYYGLTTWLGAKLLGWRVSTGLGEKMDALSEVSIFSVGFWTMLAETLRPWIWPFLLGSTIGAIVLAVVAYRLALALIVARKRALET